MQREYIMLGSPKKKRAGKKLELQRLGNIPVQLQGVAKKLNMKRLMTNITFPTKQAGERSWERLGTGRPKKDIAHIIPDH